LPSIWVNVVRLPAMPSLTALPARPRGTGTGTGGVLVGRDLPGAATAGRGRFTAVVRRATGVAIFVAITSFAFVIVHFMRGESCKGRNRRIADTVPRVVASIRLPG